MSTATALVPSNHRLREHALAAVTHEALGEIDPAAINSVWDAWRCPAPLLPFLAWALSVDLWDDAWDENTKRAAIADSPAYHRRKGTDGAVDDAAASLGRPVIMTDWHATRPEGRRGTFTVRIPLNEGEDPAELVALLGKARRVISIAKPKSRAFSITFSREVSTGFLPSVGIFAIERAVVSAPGDDAQVALSLVAGLGSLETVFIGGVQ